MPSDWKTANIASIFKKGDKHKASNYRPVSLTCILGKYMEQIIVVSSISTHLDTNKILNPIQHGFRKRLSCDRQLLSRFHDLASVPTETDMIVARLLIRCRTGDSYTSLSGIWDQGWDSFDWIKCFLTDRAQRVVLFRDLFCRESLRVRFWALSFSHLH